MPYKTCNLNNVIKQYEKYKENKTVNESQLDANHLEIRTFLFRNYFRLKSTTRSAYELDLELGLAFYEFMNTQKDFVKKYENDYDFWRYVAVFDIPEVIEDRFGLDAIDHFYKKSSRTYPYVLYWYINMSWQGNVELTRNVLKENNTDTIMQLVERPSKIGVNLKLYQEIMKQLSEVKDDRGIIFRKVMALNTNKLIAFRPELYPGGVNGYVKMLYESTKG